MEQSEYKLLNKINGVEDLRKLSIDQLPLLCKELRSNIVNELSVNPGHLASSLGVVEITVALHYVMNTPEDRIVWDVGHQAYGHKIDPYWPSRVFLHKPQTRWSAPVPVTS